LCRFIAPSAVRLWFRFGSTPVQTVVVRTAKGTQLCTTLDIEVQEATDLRSAEALAHLNP
jgi:hypothetical protein